MGWRVQVLQLRARGECDGRREVDGRVDEGRLQYNLRYKLIVRPRIQYKSIVHLHIQYKSIVHLRFFLKTTEVEPRSSRAELDRGAQLLRRNAQRFRGRLVFKAHRLCVTLNSRLGGNNEKEQGTPGKSKTLHQNPTPWCRVHDIGVGVEF